MKFIVRLFIIGGVWLILWPFLLKKIYGKKPQKLNKSIIIANHYSNLDPFIIKSIFIKEKIIFVATSDVKKHLWSHILAWAFDTIYVTTDKLNYSFFKQCISILKEEGNICIFPEGLVNSRKYGFLDFKRSYAVLALKSQANILPIYLYPNGKPFKNNIVHILEHENYNDYSRFQDSEELNMYFLSAIMESSI